MPPRLTPCAATLSVALVTGLLVTALASGCSFDWQVRPDTDDAAPSLDAATADGRIADTGEADVTVTDAPADATPDCVGLQSSVDTARLKAKACAVVGSLCVATVMDACSCEVVVPAAGTSADDTYVAAVAQLVSSCGAPSTCAAVCKPPAAPNSRLCVASGPDGYQCFQ